MSQIRTFTSRRRKGFYSWRKRRQYNTTHTFIYPTRGGKSVSVVHKTVNAYGNGDRRSS